MNWTDIRNVRIEIKANLLGLLLAVGLGTLPFLTQARIWTSISGKTLDAELVNQHDNEVILQRANGSRVKITIDKLSQADHDYLRDLAKPAEGKEETPPPEKPRGFPGVSYVPPAPLPANQYPDIESADDSANVSYWGYQYGPTPDEVFYFAFVQDHWENLFAAIYGYSPGHPLYRIPTPLKIKKKKYGGDRVLAFQLPTLRANHGPVATQLEVELINGVVRADIVIITVTATVNKGTSISSFRYCREIHTEAVSGDSVISVMPALDSLLFNFSTEIRHKNPWARCSLTMTGMQVVPGKGIGDKFRIELKKPEGKPGGRYKIELAEELNLRGGDGNPIEVHLDKMKYDIPYEVIGTFDLGPFYGLQTFTNSLTWPEPLELD